MPNRYLRAGYAQSERINRLTAEEERLWSRLLTMVDDFGRCEADALIILGTLFIRQIDTVTVDHINTWLAGMDAKGVIALYHVNGRRYVQYDNWERGRATESKFPPPQDAVYSRIRLHTCVSRRKQTQTAVYGRLQTRADADSRKQPHSTPTSTPTPSPTSKSTPNRSSSRVESTIHDYDAIHASPDPLSVAAELTGDHSLKGRKAFRRQLERIGKKAYIDTCCEFFGESKNARFNSPAAVLMSKLKKRPQLTMVNKD